MNTHTQRMGQVDIKSIATKIIAPSVEKQAKKWKPSHARFKMKIFFKDGNCKTFFSYDIYHKYTAGIKQVVTDESLGLQKLITYICSVQNSIKTACIFVTLEKEKGTDLARYDLTIFKGVNEKEGWNRKVNEPLSFCGGFLQMTDIKNRIIESMKGGNQ